MRVTFLVTILLIISQSLFCSQSKKERLGFYFKKSKNDSVYIPPIDTPELDTTNILFQDELDSSFVEEDTSSFFYFEESHDNIANFEDVQKDSLVDSFHEPQEMPVVLLYHENPYVQDVFNNIGYWKSIDTCFANFDSLNVNPYKVDGAKIKDTTVFTLYDDDRSWSLPLDTNNITVSSKFGQRGYRFHYGTDLRLKIGDSVRAVFDGVVRIRKFNTGGYGNYVMIRHHNGLETLYGHLSKQVVKVGQVVKAGECIGLGGNTGRSSGPHLHFETRFKGNAFNPESLFSFRDTDTLMYKEYEIMPSHFEYIRIQRQKVYHRIRSGNTLYGIARRYRVSVNQICRLNKISRKTTLRIGRKLRIK